MFRNRPFTIREQKSETTIASPGGKMKENDIYAEYLNLVDELKDFERNKIPLCAAETRCSPFVRSALGSVFEGKYCMQNSGYCAATDFIGSQYVHRLYELLNRQCSKMFKSTYSDARTLSGMNCVATVINCFLPEGGKVLLTDPEQGGHPSIPLLLELNQVAFDPIPYDYSSFDIDYSELNIQARRGGYDAIIIAQSDLLVPADVSRISADGTPVIYDATQTLGTIAARVHNNPLDDYENLVLIGGTHKTLPGPTCGLILTRQACVADKLDSFISPSYLRNTQPDHIAAVLLALIEQEQFGAEYQQAIIKNANYLAARLKTYGFNVLSIDGNTYTKTHQIFISVTQEEKARIVENAFRFGITLNGKQKRLFNGHGIRLGMQEITRYGWGCAELDAVALLLSMLNDKNPDAGLIDGIKETLNAKKEVRYTFQNDVKE